MSSDYRHAILSNLEDLLGPEGCIDPRINLLCVYSEIESVVSTLLPRWLDIEGIAGDGDVTGAIEALAGDCDWRDEMRDLRESAEQARARRGDERIGIDRLQSAVAVAECFVARLAAQSYLVRCRCGAGIPYRLADALNLVPPATCRLVCPACRQHTVWHLPPPFRC